MIKINKGKEPEAWIKFRKTHGVKFEANPELRQSLLDEQGYIWAYCMQRIDFENTKVEHIKPQSKHQELQFEYSNLIICCEGKTSNNSHCDDSKSNKEISFDIFSDYFSNHIKYGTKDGEIYFKRRWNKNDNDQEVIDFNDDIYKTLNLNIDILKKNRLKALEGLITVLKIKKSKAGTKKEEFTASIKEKQLAKLQEKRNGKFFPYVGILIYFLKK